MIMPSSLDHQKASAQRVAPDSRVALIDVIICLAKRTSPTLGPRTHVGAPKRCFFLTQLRESSLYRSRIVNTWRFDMDDVEAVIEQANDAIGTPPEAPAEAPEPEVKKMAFDMVGGEAVIEQATDAVGTPTEAPAEAPKPELKKVGQSAKKVARKARPKKKVAKKAKTPAKKSAKKSPKKAKPNKKKSKKAKR